MEIETARNVIATIPEARHAELADAHERYMHFAGVYTGEITEDQIARDREAFAHLREFTAHGKPMVSDKRCAEFMAAVTGLPVEWCMAWDEAEFVATHGEDYLTTMTKVERSSLVATKAPARARSTVTKNKDAS